MTTNPLAFLAEFRVEATEHLSALDQQLLRLERDPSASEPIRAMFLAAHSIKGGAAMLGLTELRELAHALEDVLAGLRDHRRPLDDSTANVLFRVVDRLRALLPEADGGARPSSPVSLALVAELTMCATNLAVTQPKATSAAPRVLLVEDSPSVRQLETFLLMDAGFVVDATEAANEAVQWARTIEYRLVVAGVETRELRGPDLVLALRATTAEHPVPVMLTTTDHGPASPASTADVVFAAKGRLDTGDFLRVVRELTA